MAHTLKSIAQERNLTYQSHGDARAVVRVILRDAPTAHYDAIIGGFAAADNLHRNFYEDIHLQEDLDKELGVVSRAIAVLYEEQERWRERNRLGAGPAGV